MADSEWSTVIHALLMASGAMLALRCRRVQMA